jgi:hypothetical protein
MNAGSERGVKLTAPLPIYLVYLTAWEEGGVLRTVRDSLRARQTPRSDERGRMRPAVAVSVACAVLVAGRDATADKFDPETVPFAVTFNGETSSYPRRRLSDAWRVGDAGGGERRDRQVFAVAEEEGARCSRACGGGATPRRRVPASTRSNSTARPQRLGRHPRVRARARVPGEERLAERIPIGSYPPASKSYIPRKASSRSPRTTRTRSVAAFQVEAAHLQAGHSGRLPEVRGARAAAAVEAGNDSRARQSDGLSRPTRCT